MALGKEDKWLLASHLQKSVRRGLEEEARWAAGELHTVDRAYLAYRLSVIAVEDIGAGDPTACSQWVDTTKPWGAKRFDAVKSTADQSVWMDVAGSFARATKDRTPCEWMACRFWLAEFEQEVGAWASLEPSLCVEQAYDASKPWWWRGLMAWRAAGTDRFPTDSLPSLTGVWDQWIDHAPVDTRVLLTGLGARQREGHPVFLPLAVHDRIHDPHAVLQRYDVGPLIKHGMWLSAALDKHTSEGKRALFNAIRRQPMPIRQQLVQQVGQDNVIDVIGALMFWMEGGRVDKTWNYGTSQTMNTDIKKRWLAHHHLSGRWLFDHWGTPDLWQEERQRVIVAQFPHGGLSPP